QNLHVEDFLDALLELQEFDGLTTVRIEDPDAAFELLPAFGQGQTTEGRGLADPGQSHEGVATAKGQAARVAGQLGNGNALTIAGIDDKDTSGPRIEDPQSAAMDTWVV